MFFKDSSDLGLFNGSDPVHDQECIRFCFTQLLRDELQQVAEMWNQLIASNKFENSSGPRGINQRYALKILVKSLKSLP